MTNKPWFRNMQIGLMLSACYVVGMIAAYYTTESLRLYRGGGTNVQAEANVARGPSM